MAAAGSRNPNEKEESQKEMSSYLICTLDISVFTRPEDREQAKEMIVEATLPVLEEMGYRYTREKLAEQLAPADYGVDSERTVGVHLYREDMNYKLRDCDADTRVQELCEQIAEKLNGMPGIVGTVNIYADWNERPPDISGRACLPYKPDDGELEDEPEADDGERNEVLTGSDAGDVQDDDDDEEDDSNDLPTESGYYKVDYTWDGLKESTDYELCEVFVGYGKKLMASSMLFETLFPTQGDEIERNHLTQPLENLEYVEGVTLYWTRLVPEIQTNKR